MIRIIGIGEYVISNDVTDTIKTFALSTCVALIAYSPIKKVLGMVHIALPYSGAEKVAQPPGYYADMAVPLIIEEMCSNYSCSPKELIFSLYGGASSTKAKDIFKIGENNTNAVKELLSSYLMAVGHEETGGICSRTVETDVATGHTRIECHPIIL